MKKPTSRRQPSLFDADQAELSFDAYAPPESRPIEAPGEQLLLFEGRAPLIGEMEAAFFDGDYREARRWYLRLRDTYPGDSSVSRFELLLRIPEDLWERSRSDEERLAVWDDIKAGFLGPAIHRLRDGFFRRLLQVVDVHELAISHPELAPDIANHLLSAGEYLTGRKVVRDVLIAGHDLKPRSLDDEAVAELLGEEGAPVWLACLGAIRRLWPRTDLAIEHGDAIAAKLAGPLPEDERDRGLDFWFCLCVSGLSGRIPEEVRHDAHRRMKRLHPRFHEEYMTGRWGRTEFFANG